MMLSILVPVKVFAFLPNFFPVKRMVLNPAPADSKAFELSVVKEEGIFNDKLPALVKTPLKVLPSMIAKAVSRLILISVREVHPLNELLRMVLIEVGRVTLHGINRSSIASLSEDNS